MKKEIESDLTTVEIVLENCEVFTFDACDISVIVKGLGKSFWSGDFVYNTAKYAQIYIKKSAEASGGWENEKWQDRIRQDIAQVHLNFADGSSLGYHLDWDIEGSDYENSYEEDTENEVEKVYTICNPKWKEIYE